MDWFRWHHGSVTDPKFQLVAKKAKASVAEVVAVWAYVLETASQNPKRGHVDGLDAEAIDLALGMDDGTTAAILAVLNDRGILSEGRIAAWEKRQPKKEDETATDRQRRKREREHELALAAVSASVTDDMSRHVTPCHAASRPVTLEEKREEEKDQKQDQKKEQGARATRLPQDWQPSPDELAWARNARPDVDPAAEAAKFRDYWHAKGGKDAAKADWSATWRNWIRNSHAPPRRGTPNAAPSKQMQGLANILGLTHENDDSARLVLDLNPTGFGADVRQLPSGFPGC